MNQRPRSKAPSIVAIRNRTTDRAACHQDVRKKRVLKNNLVEEINTPTHIGVKRFLTSASANLIKQAMIEGPKREAEKSRLMNTDIGKIAVASGMRLDVIKSHRIKNPAYAQGLLDAAVMMQMSADGPPAVPVSAEVLGVDIDEQGRFIMSVDSKELRNERYTFGSIMMRDAVPATRHITKETPLEIVIGKYRFDEESEEKEAEGRNPLNVDEARELTSGIYLALVRAQADTSDMKPTVQFQPWDFTKGFARAVQAQACARGQST